MEYAVDGAARMQRMIDALLQYSRLTMKGDELVETDAEAVLEETVKSLEMLVEDCHGTVDCGDLPPVVVDRNQLGQLFQNLIENALHYGGEEPTVTVDAEQEGDRVRFTFADDGPGIETDQQDRIFEIFKQNSTRSGSTGIGLAMCRRIVNRHDGEIWVESEPDEGATFHFSLPAAEESKQEIDA
jgi:signal transduction histidine kinase